MLRIIGIIICLFNKPESMTAHEVAELSHTYFNIAVYAVIGLYFYWWVKWSSHWTGKVARARD
jgi:hypothetical protein